MSPKRTLPAVARSRRFQQALGKRVKVLDQNLPAALEHDVEALHRSRVASRRLREALPVLEAPDGDAHRAKRSRGRVRRLTAALGGVRELDVALALLDEVTAGRGDLVPTVTAVRSEIQRERAVRYAQMMRSLGEIKPGKLARDLASLVETANGSSGVEQQRRLRERVLRRTRRLDEAVEQAGALYAFDRLHRVRIAAKKLRYALELVQELTGLGTRRLVARLKQLQDLLGRLHDLEVLASYVRRAGGAAALERGLDVAGLLQLIENETRQLHADYLSKGPALTLVTAASRDMGGRLARHPSHGTRRP